MIPQKVWRKSKRVQVREGISLPSDIHSPRLEAPRNQEGKYSSEPRESLHFVVKDNTMNSIFSSVFPSDSNPPIQSNSAQHSWETSCLKTPGKQRGGIYGCEVITDNNNCGIVMLFGVSTLGVGSGWSGNQHTARDWCSWFTSSDTSGADSNDS